MCLILYHPVGGDHSVVHLAISVGLVCWSWAQWGTTRWLLGRMRKDMVLSPDWYGWDTALWVLENVEYVYGGIGR